jgi:Flp pilus assembly protein TadD
MAKQSGYRLLEAPAATAHATVTLAQGRLDEAIDRATAALVVHDDIGYKLGQARTRMLLGEAQDRRGDRHAARDQWRRALTLFTELGLPEAAEVRGLLDRASRS